MTTQIGGSIGSRIKVTASDGATILDTAERLFVPHTFVTGTKSFPTRVPPVFTTTDHVLASVPASSTHVLGAIRNTYTNFWEGQPPDTAWWNCSGSLFHILGSQARMLISMRVESGELIMTEQLVARRVYINAAGQFASILAYDVDYKVWVGEFH